MKRLSALVLLMALIAGTFTTFAQDEPIRVVGSGEIAPFMTALYENYPEAESIEITVEAEGTDAGIEQLCSGEADIAFANRPMNAAEIEACAVAGIEWVEAPVAYDAIVLITSVENDFAECLPREAVASVFALVAEGGPTAWNILDENYPEDAITLLAPPPDDPAYETFTEGILGEGGLQRTDITQETADIISTVAEDPNALAYISHSQYKPSSDEVKLIGVDYGEGCILPSPATVQDGYRLLSRPFYAYIATGALEKPGIEAFVEFAWQPEQQGVIQELNLIPPSEETYAAALTNIQERVTGRTLSREPFELPGVLPTDTITISGSPSAYPLTQLISSDFSAVYPGVMISQEITDTVTALERLCLGNLDFANASRPMLEIERVLCEDNGVSVLEYNPATMTAAVIVNEESDVECLTMDELAQIFGPEGPETWGEVREEWDDEALKAFSPGPQTRLYDFFSAATHGSTERTDATIETDIDELLAGVESTPGGIAYLDLNEYAEYSELPNNFKGVAIENEAGECVMPAEEAVLDGTYPLTRPVYVYVNAGELERAAVQTYLWLYLNAEKRDDIRARDFVPAADDFFAQNRETLESLIGEFAYKTPRVYEVPDDVSGEVQIDGLESLTPLSEALAQAAAESYPDLTVTVGDGDVTFADLCNRGIGSLNVMQAAEGPSGVQACQDFTLQALPVAYNALVIIGAADDGVDLCLNQTDLRLTFSSPTQEVPINNWRDINADQPDLDIAVYMLPDSAAETTFLTDQVMTGSILRNDDAVTVLTDPVELMNAVATTPGAIGYVSLADLLAADLDVMPKVFEIRESGECVAPNIATVSGGSYNLLSAPLYLYTTDDDLGEEAVRSWLWLYLADAEDYALEAGLLPLDQASISAARQSLLDAIDRTLAAAASDADSESETEGDMESAEDTSDSAQE